MSTSFLTTRDTNLAAALASFGIPFFAPDPIRRVMQDGVETVSFNFEPTKQAQEIAKNWQNAGFMEANPEHPLAYIVAFHHNRNRLLDLIKQAPAVQIIQKNGKIFFIPLNKESQP